MDAVIGARIGVAECNGVIHAARICAAADCDGIALFAGHALVCAQQTLHHEMIFGHVQRLAVAAQSGRDAIGRNGVCHGGQQFARLGAYRVADVEHGEHMAGFAGEYAEVAGQHA